MRAFTKRFTATLVAAMAFATQAKAHDATFCVPVSQTLSEAELNPAIVGFETEAYGVGTIVIETNECALYFTKEDGTALRFRIAVGREGFAWSGESFIERKQVWPDWYPPQEMIAREAEKGHFLPIMMPGGENNPLGARAMYIAKTAYRIHGTNTPTSIGTHASSGCIRMLNEQVKFLFEIVPVGAKVVVK